MVLHEWQEAISEYTGTVITVSHDRYFIKQIVNRVIEVKDQTIQDYQGDYNVSSPMTLKAYIYSSFKFLIAVSMNYAEFFLLLFP